MVRTRNNGQFRTAESDPNLMRLGGIMDMRAATEDDDNEYSLAIQT